MVHKTSVSAEKFAFASYKVPKMISYVCIHPVDTASIVAFIESMNDLDSCDALKAALPMEFITSPYFSACASM